VSVVLLAVLFVVGSLGWMARDRTAREEEIARDRAARQALIRERVTLALGEARRRQEEGRWREALDAAKRAEALAAAGETDVETLLQVREVLGDMQMLANLEDVRARSTINEAGYDLKEEDRGTAQAFREYGIDIDELDRDEAAARIKARSIRYELTVFLDSWSHVRRRLAQRGQAPGGKDWKELLEVARAADPDPWRDRFRKAVLNDDRKALAELAASAPLASLPVETVDRLGDALLGRETLKEAVDFLKRGQRLHPDDYWINVNLANSLLQLGAQHREDALRYYTAAVALRPQAALSHTNLANALEIHGKLDEASAAYREALRLKPSDAMARFNLGVVLGKQGKLDGAVAAYKEALRRKPNLLAQTLLNNLAWDYARSDPKARDAKGAAELVKQALALNPHLAQNPNAELMAGYAPMLLLGDDTDTYRQQCASVMGKLGNSTTPREAYLVARICTLAPGAVPDATRLVSIADRAVKASPTAHYLHTLGLAYYRGGRFDRAIEELNRSTKANWNANAANWLVLAMAHERLGQTDEARKWFDKAVQWLDNPHEKATQTSANPLQSIHPQDALACLVLRREAAALLGIQPRQTP
jgi:serine/threonine-protein kinase